MFQSLLAIGIVLLAATVGQVALGVGRRDGPRPHHLAAGPGGRRRAGRAGQRDRDARWLSWFLASSLRPGPVPSLSRQISDSRIVTAVDEVMPESARTLFSSFRRVLDDNGLPTVFGGLSPERIRAGPPAERRT